MCVCAPPKWWCSFLAALENRKMGGGLSNKTDVVVVVFCVLNRESLLSTGIPSSESPNHFLDPKAESDRRQLGSQVQCSTSGAHHVLRVTIIPLGFSMVSPGASQPKEKAIRTVILSFGLPQSSLEPIGVVDSSNREAGVESPWTSRSGNLRDLFAPVLIDCDKIRLQLDRSERVHKRKTAGTCKASPANSLQMLGRSIGFFSVAQGIPPFVRSFFGLRVPIPNQPTHNKSDTGGLIADGNPPVPVASETTDGFPPFSPTFFGEGLPLNMSAKNGRRYFVAPKKLQCD